MYCNGENELKGKGWDVIVSRFNEKNQICYVKKQITNRWSLLRKDFRSIVCLNNYSGGGGSGNWTEWSEDQWREFGATNPDLLKFKNPVEWKHFGKLKQAC